jgi:hypothetical protein
MKYEGISFDQKWVASFESEDDFLDVTNEEGYKHLLDGDNNKREDKLREVYALATKKPAVGEDGPKK